jgi:PEGA domain
MTRALMVARACVAPVLGALMFAAACVHAPEREPAAESPRSPPSATNAGGAVTAPPSTAPTAPAPSAATADGGVPAPAAPAAAKPTKVRIVVRSIPPKALVAWGKKQLGPTPVIFERPRESGPIDLVVRSEGYFSVHTRMYTFRNDAITVKLTKLADRMTIFGAKQELPPPAPDGGAPPPTPPMPDAGAAPAQ